MTIPKSTQKRIYLTIKSILIIFLILIVPMLVNAQDDDLFGEAEDLLIEQEIESNTMKDFLDGSIELNALNLFHLHEPHKWYASYRLDLELQKHFERFQLYVNMSAQYQTFDTDPMAFGNVREGYGVYSHDFGNMKYAKLLIGKHIKQIGRSDEIGVIDVIYPEELQSMYVYDKNDRKSGRIGIFGDISFSENILLEGFWSPFFEKSDLPGRDSVYEFQVLSRLYDLNMVSANEEKNNLDYANSYFVRLSLNLWKQNIRFYGFKGFLPIPIYAISSYMQISEQLMIPVQVQAIYPETEIFAMDFEGKAKFLGITYRGELAYYGKGNEYLLNWAENPTILAQYSKGTVESDCWKYNVGFDVVELFGVHSLFFNIQYQGEYIIDYFETIVSDKHLEYIGVEISYDLFDAKLGIKLRALYDINEDEHRDFIEANYRIKPWCTFSVGYINYYGKKENTLLGQYQDNDFLYGKLNIYF